MVPMTAKIMYKNMETPKRCFWWQPTLQSFFVVGFLFQPTSESSNCHSRANILWLTDYSASFLFHAINPAQCNFLPVHRIIAGNIRPTLLCCRAWGKVQGIWMILVCMTYRLFIYHHTWASCSKVYYSKTWWNKILKKIYMAILTVSQHDSATWIKLGKKYMTLYKSYDF